MKKILVLYDSEGKIISAGEPAPTAQLKGAPRVEFGPQPQRGQKVAELDLPAEHDKLDLHEVVEKLRVDIKGKAPYLRLSKGR